MKKNTVKKKKNSDFLCLQFKEVKEREKRIR